MAASQNGRLASMRHPSVPLIVLLLSSLHGATPTTVHLFASPSFVAPSSRGAHRIAFGKVTKSPLNPLLREGLSPWDVAWWNTYPSVAAREGGNGTGPRFQLWYNGFSSCGGAETPGPGTLMCPSTDYLCPSLNSTFQCEHRRVPPATDRQRPMSSLFYAESEDGLEWKRPDLFQVPWPTRGSNSSNNIAIDHGTADPNTGVLLDPREAEGSLERYKCFGSFTQFNNQSIGRSRLGVATSKDGKAWADYVAVDEMRVNADTANNIHWDEHLQQYIAFSRRDVHDGSTATYGVRRETRSVASKHTGPWSEAVECARGESGYELYALSPWRAQGWPNGTYFAIGMFYDTRAGGGEKVYCELMSSSDFGQNWTRVAPHKPFIPLGGDGAFDSHTCYSASPLIEEEGGGPSTTRIYYAGGNGPHSGARSDFIALATTSTHAFVGLRGTGIGSGGEDDGGAVVTAGVCVGGGASLLVAVGPNGSVEVGGVPVAIEEKDRGETPVWLDIIGIIDIIIGREEEGRETNATNHRRRVACPPLKIVARGGATLFALRHL